MHCLRHLEEAFSNVDQRLRGYFQENADKAPDLRIWGIFFLNIIAFVSPNRLWTSTDLFLHFPVILNHLILSRRVFSSRSQALQWWALFVPEERTTPTRCLAECHHSAFGHKPSTEVKLLNCGHGLSSFCDSFRILVLVKKFGESNLNLWNFPKISWCFERHVSSIPFGSILSIWDDVSQVDAFFRWLG